MSDQHTKLRRPTRRSCEIQEEVVSTLWEFAEALGAPIADPGRMVDRARLNAVGPAVERVMAVLGYHVAEIQ